MNEKIKKKVSIIRSLVLTNKKQNYIAFDHNVSESYVSQIARKIRNLINPPKIINGKLICFKCNKESDNLDFHHAIGYDGYVAIVCHSCNVKLGQNYLTYKYETTDGKKPIITWVSEEMYIKISKIASEMEEGNISRFIRNLLKTVIKNS